MLAVDLPLLSIASEDQSDCDSLLMVLGGRAPAAHWLRELDFGGEVWAVDRGIRVCRDAGIVPSLLIGDFDSADDESLRWAKAENVPILSYKADKDLTDFKLALDILRERSADEDRARPKRLFLTGALGGRLDHLYSIVMSFASAEPPIIPFCAADDREGLLIMRGRSSFSFSFDAAPKAVSLFALSEVCGDVSITGTRWPLDGVTLCRDFPYSVSNRFDGGGDLRADVSCGSGTLCFYWVWDESALK